MALLNIRIIGDPVLRSKAKKVENISDKTINLVDNMVNTMYENKGIGLAAPQVGILQQIIVIDIEDNLIKIINPEIVEALGENIDKEACLSIPEEEGLVTRASKVIIRGLNLEGKQVTIEAEGLLARVLQHEIDHLQGILFTDKTKKIELDDKR